MEYCTTIFGEDRAFGSCSLGFGQDAEGSSVAARPSAVERNEAFDGNLGLGDWIYIFTYASWSDNATCLAGLAKT